MHEVGTIAIVIISVFNTLRHLISRAVSVWLVKMGRGISGLERKETGCFAIMQSQIRLYSIGWREKEDIIVIISLSLYV